MFAKAGFVALAMVPVFGTVQPGDVRDLYNEMYPVDALKRDAFDLCHESDANFIRALQADRESCFGRMSHNFAMAIGYVRPDSQLAAIGFDPRDPTVSDLFLAEALAAPARPSRPLAERLLASLDGAAGMVPCRAEPAAASGADPSRLELLQTEASTVGSDSGAHAALANLPAIGGEGRATFRMPVRVTAGQVSFSRAMVPSESGSNLPMLKLSPAAAAAAGSAAPTGCPLPV